MKAKIPSCLLTTLAAIALGAAPVQAQAVLQTPLPPLPDDQEMLVLEVDLAPGQSSQPHRHNAHVFVYVLEGTVNMQVEGGELMTLSPGEMFYENPDDIHTVSANASDSEPARILVHLIKTAGAPVTTPAGR
ncbi:MAG: cupin domain-containing protein [Gemmatimonadetes bacterium]|nr:cupin domain-containing protein [Gemmatimonadota bacterium]